MPSYRIGMFERSSDATSPWRRSAKASGLLEGQTSLLPRRLSTATWTRSRASKSRSRCMAAADVGTSHTATCARVGTCSGKDTERKHQAADEDVLTRPSTSCDAQGFTHKYLYRESSDQTRPPRGCRTIRVPLPEKRARRRELAAVRDSSTCPLTSVATGLIFESHMGSAFRFYTVVSNPCPPTSA